MYLPKSWCKPPMPSARLWQRLNHESRISVFRNSRCTRNTAYKSLPIQKNTKLYGRHRSPYNLVFIWCFNLQNGLFRKVTIHIFECHKTPQYRTFLDFGLLYGGDKLLLQKKTSIQHKARCYGTFRHCTEVFGV